MFDLYALPKDFPGQSDAGYPTTGTGAQKARYLEEKLQLDIDEPNFLPHLLVHEFEALLLTDPQKFAEWTDGPEVVAELTLTRKGRGPEDINDGPLTAPSKRVRKAMPAYQKTFHGPLIACEIGLDAIRQSCPHFNAWLTRLEGFQSAAQ